MAEVTEMFLCETERLGLHHDQLYVFRVDPTCSRCKELAAMAPEGFVPPHPEGTGIYTETERDAAVAGAYRAAADDIKHWLKFEHMNITAAFSEKRAEERCEAVDDFADSIVTRISALTPASAQKAFADAVAAEVARNLHAYRTTAEEMKQQLTRLTEKKERLAKALQDGHDLVASAWSHVSHGGPTRADAEKWLADAQAALTPAAGGEMRGNDGKVSDETKA